MFLLLYATRTKHLRSFLINFFNSSCFYTNFLIQIYRCIRFLKTSKLIFSNTEENLTKRITKKCFFRLWNCDTVRNGQKFQQTKTQNIKEKPQKLGRWKKPQNLQGGPLPSPRPGPVLPVRSPAQLAAAIPQLLREENG